MKMASELLPGPTCKIDNFLSDCRAVIDARLDGLLPAANIGPERVHQAIRWSVFAGGKRFRPSLLLAVGQTFQASNDLLLNTACALEMIHTYSLIHDDLPSMDNDDLRRGRPTCHVHFDEATAILAGDGLQAFAFKTVAQDYFLDADTRVSLISEIANAAGTPNGMVAGQAHDIEAESRQVSGVELEEIHRRKTGALIVVSARCGAIIARASSKERDLITDYASQLGLLFQITDDLLDVTATAEDLGKTPGKDARSLKATYPGLYGIGATQDAAIRVHNDARAPLQKIDRPTEMLGEIADFILNRTA
jgi:geranylgeranyl pyrophosphate synthase